MFPETRIQYQCPSYGGYTRPSDPDYIAYSPEEAPLIQLGIEQTPLQAVQTVQEHVQTPLQAVQTVQEHVQTELLQDEAHHLQMYPHVLAVALPDQRKPLTWVTVPPGNSSLQFVCPSTHGFEGAVEDLPEWRPLHTGVNCRSVFLPWSSDKRVYYAPLVLSRGDEDQEKSVLSFISQDGASICRSIPLNYTGVLMDSKIDYTGEVQNEELLIQQIRSARTLAGDKPFSEAQCLRLKYCDSFQLSFALYGHVVLTLEDLKNILHIGEGKRIKKGKLIHNLLSDINRLLADCDPVQALRPEYMQDYFAGFSQLYDTLWEFGEEYFRVRQQSLESEAVIPYSATISELYRVLVYLNPFIQNVTNRQKLSGEPRRSLSCRMFSEAIRKNFRLSSSTLGRPEGRTTSPFRTRI